LLSLDIYKTNDHNISTLLSFVNLHVNLETEREQVKRNKAVEKEKTKESPVEIK